jgi:hypothetical protein
VENLELVISYYGKIGIQELFFNRQLWPDFGKDEFVEALSHFKREKDITVDDISSFSPALCPYNLEFDRSGVKNLWTKNNKTCDQQPISDFNKTILIRIRLEWTKRCIGP